jgi:tetratricopeptide (TPR) repeat protein
VNEWRIGVLALDPESSEALSARANFEALQYRFRGDVDALAHAHADFRRALELDPANAQATFAYARMLFWTQPELALEMYERTLQLDPVKYSADGQAAILLSRQGRHDEARGRARALYEGNPGRQFHNAINIAVLEYYLGQIDEAVVHFRETMPRGLWDLPIQLWGLEMSLGNRQAASEALGLVPAGSAAEPLADAARLCMDHRFDAAFELLESRRSAYPTSRILDVPAARLALLARRPVDAAAILEQRMPGVVSGDEPRKWIDPERCPSWGRCTRQKRPEPTDWSGRDRAGM